jgi:signal transduction histidine kinase
MAQGSDLLTASAEELQGDRDGFCADLADGLHALAQPLTILRSAIAMLSLANDPETPRHRCLDISVRQIERTCSLFASVQDLVSSRAEAASSAAVDVNALLTQAIDDCAPAYRELGVEVIAPHQDSIPQVFGDSHRTERALSASLEAALSISSEGDTVEISVLWPNDFVEVVVANAPRHRRNLNASERLHLSVAKANVLSQHGKYEFAEEPFRVTLALPISKTDGQTKETLSAAYAD